LLDVVEEGLLGIRLYRARLDRTVLKREQLGSAIAEEQAREYYKAREVFLALKRSFESLGDYDAASWAYRKERRMEKLAAWQDAQKARQEHYWGIAARKYLKVAGNQLVELVCDYGEGVWRVMASFVLVWLFFAVIYGLINGVWEVWQAMGACEVRSTTRNPLDMLWFSLGTMVTLHPPGLEARSTAPM
jgi:hypothetical protein